MKKEQLGLWLQAHRFLGVTLGIVIFATCLTGTAMVFRDELRLWCSPLAQRSAELGERAPEFSNARELEGEELSRVVQSFLAEHPIDQVSRGLILLPDNRDALYELIYQKPQAKSLTRAYIDARDLAYLGESSVQAADFIFAIHANLALRGKLGRTLVGIMGVFMLLLIVTGVLIHRKKIKNLFALRWVGTARRFYTDAHNAMGLWGLPFHFMIAFTGAILGVKSLLVLVPAVAEFRGDVRKAKQELRPPAVQRNGEMATMAPIAQLWQEGMAKLDEEIEQDFVPTMISLDAWGEKPAVMSISGAIPGALLPENEAFSLRLSGVDAKVKDLENGLEGGMFRRGFDALAPLHYGDFSGWSLRILYFLFGISTTILAATGLSIWAQRQSQLKKD